jgi:hypothetical protein
VGGESLNVVHFKSEVGEVGAELHFTAGGEGADLDEFVAVGCLQEDELGAAWGLVTAHFFEAEDLGIEVHGLGQIVNAVAGVEEFRNHKI